VAASLEPVPESLEDRREKVLSAYINLVDLHEQGRMGLKTDPFKTLEELREYTCEEDKRYPKEDAYADELLKYMLREIDNRYFGHRRPKNWKGPRGGMMRER